MFLNFVVTIMQKSVDYRSVLCSDSIYIIYALNLLFRQWVLSMHYL